MDLGFSSRGRYVVRAAIFLADAYGSGHLRTGQEVSEAVGVPHAFVPQVLSDLIHSGLVVSTPGVGGGYRLARPPEEVLLLDVVEAGEGPLRLAGNGRVRTLRTGKDGSDLDVLWSEAAARFRRSLGVTTLAQLVDRGDERGGPAARLPCGVLAVSRRPGGDPGMPAGGLVAEDVGEEEVERHRHRVRVAPRPRGRDGDGGEQHPVEEDDEQ